MSEYCLNLLQQLDLLTNSDRVNISEIGKLTDDELQTKLDAYAASRRNAAENNKTLWVPIRGELNSLFSSISANSTVNDILQAAIIYSRIVVDDPLIGFARRQPNKIESLYTQAMGVSQVASFKKSDVIKNLYFFENLAPLIREGMLTIHPLGTLRQKPEFGIINYSADWYASMVPEPIRNFVYNHARIGEIRPTPGKKGLIMTGETPTKPGRGITVNFNNDDEKKGGGAFYILFEMEYVKTLGERQILTVQAVPWDSPPTRDEYEGWIFQSVNQTIIKRLEQVAVELAMADQIRGIYLTTSRFEAELLAKLGSIPDDNRHTSENSIDAVNFLKAIEPDLRVESASQIVKLRTSNGKLFDRFRETLIEKSAELHGANDFSKKANEILINDIVPQVREIEDYGRKAMHSAVGASIGALGSVGLAVLASPALPLSGILACSVLMAAGPAYQSTVEYAQQRKTPAYIWKQIIK